MPKDIVDFRLRMPKKLHKELQQNAARSGRSLNSEIVAQLQHRGAQYERIISLQEKVVALEDRQSEDDRKVSAMVRLAKDEAAKAPTTAQDQAFRAELEQVKAAVCNLAEIVVKQGAALAMALSTDQLGEVVLANVEKALARRRQ